MFDFDEEVKRFEPSTDADLAAFELHGDEAADLQTILKLMSQKEENSRSGRDYSQMGLEDFR